MEEMMKKVEDFVAQSDKLMGDCLKIVMTEMGVSPMDVMSEMTDIPLEHIKLLQDSIKLYALAKEITIGQYQMLESMNKKLDQLILIEQIEK